MRSTVLTAVGVTLAAVLAFGVLATGNNPKHQLFKDQTRQRLSALEATVATQAQQIDDLLSLYADIDAGLLDLTMEDGVLWQLDRNLLATQEIVFAEHPSIELTNITAEVECDGTECVVDVSWNSDPPATGQLEWGLTEEYGNLGGKEDKLLGFHRQRLGTLPEDGTEYHYRVLADIPDVGEAMVEMQFVSLDTTA